MEVISVKFIKLESRYFNLNFNKFNLSKKKLASNNYTVLGSGKLAIPKLPMYTNLKPLYKL